MDRIDLKTSFRCNNSCRFCVQAHNKNKGKDKSTAKIIEILKEACKTHKAVVFTGGEVSIRDDFFEIVAAARGFGFEQIHIQSNGRRFYYKDFCAKAIEAGATEFGFALHGHIPELHDYLTRASGSFVATLRGICNIVEMGKPVMTNTVVTKSNYRHLPELARVLTTAGVSQYQFAFVHITGNARTYAMSVVPRKSLVSPYIMRGLDIGIKNGISVMTEAYPVCFLPGYEQYIAERVIPETKVYDADSIIESFTQIRKEHGKIKGPPCKECCVCAHCEGPWREYPELFGWDEFKPVKRPAALSVMRIAFNTGATEPVKG